MEKPIKTHRRGPPRNPGVRELVDSVPVNFGIELGLQVNAGHGLSYQNVKPIAAIPGVKELNIGHAIVARALFSGFATAVREMKRLMMEARGNR